LKVLHVTEHLVLATEMMFSSNESEQKITFTMYTRAAGARENFDDKPANENTAG
jgi:hypothetical protein